MLLVPCIDKVKGERSSVGICLLDGSVLQPTEAAGGEGKDLAALGSSVHRGVSRVLTPVLCPLHCKGSTAQSVGHGSNPLQQLCRFTEDMRG